jgi:N-acetylneuraminic acid mutarotase
MSTRHLVAALLIAIGSALIAGCGSGSEEPATSGSAATATTRPGETPAAATGSTPPQTGSPWSTRAELLVANSEIAVADLAGKIYVIGGYPSSRVVTNAVQVYTAATNSWAMAAPMPVALHHTMAAGVGGKLYVIGGETPGSGATNGEVPASGPGFVPTVFEYDPGTNAWRQRTAMPTARSGGAVAVLDGKIYVAGGRPPRGADFAVYDPALDRWTVLPDLPTQRNHLAATAIDAKIYVAGGRFGGGVGSEMTAMLEVYDPARNAWEARAPLPKPRAGLNGIAARGCFYTFGGEGNDADPRGIFAEMEVYNPRTNAWSSLPPIPTPVHGVTGAAYFDGWIHLVGGGTTRGGSSGSTLHQVFRADVSCS